MTDAADIAPVSRTGIALGLRENWQQFALLVLITGLVLEVRSRAIGLPGVLVAVLLAVAGPPVYVGLRGRRTAAAAVAR